MAYEYSENLRKHLNLQSYQKSKNLLRHLNLSEVEKIEMTPNRIKAQMPILREWISYFREYPDKFVDFLLGDFKRDENEKRKGFNLFFYQRIFLRVALRYRYVYATFPRA